MQLIHVMKNHGLFGGDGCGFGLILLGILAQLLYLYTYAKLNVKMFAANKKKITIFSFTNEKNYKILLIQALVNRKYIRTINDERRKL